MKYKYTSLKPIVDILREKWPLSPSEIAWELWKTRALIQKYLRELVARGEVVKDGNTPHVKYRLKNSESIPQKREPSQLIDIDYPSRKIIDDNFTKFTSVGDRLDGLIWLQKWITTRSGNQQKILQNFINIQSQIASLYNVCGLINATWYFWKQFEEVFLDRVYYWDQYIWGEFWRGRIAEITFFAKQSQNKDLIQESIDTIFPKLECLIAREKYSALIITPWSIERKNQLLKILKNQLSLFWIPVISLEKYSPSKIFIPQKSLKTSQERIENARNTIFVDSAKIEDYKKVLLIDDFVGSGATLNESAKKLKDVWIHQVDWFAFVGNIDLNDYEVIREI